MDLEAARNRRHRRLKLDVRQRLGPTILYKSGVKNEDIQGILRHNNLRTSMQIYVSSVLKSRTAAMESLGESFATSLQLTTRSERPVN
jgi:hypothetical protein